MTDDADAPNTDKPRAHHAGTCRHALIDKREWQCSQCQGWTVTRASLPAVVDEDDPTVDERCARVKVSDRVFQSIRTLKPNVDELAERRKRLKDPRS